MAFELKQFDKSFLRELQFPDLSFGQLYFRIFFHSECKAQYKSSLKQLEAVSRLCMSTSDHLITLNQSEPGLSFLFLNLQYSPLPEADLERAARTVMTSAPAPFSLAMPVREGRGRIQTRHSLPDLFEVITEALNRIFKFFQYFFQYFPFISTPNISINPQLNHINIRVQITTKRLHSSAGTLKISHHPLQPR